MAALCCQQALHQLRATRVYAGECVQATTTCPAALNILHTRLHSVNVGPHSGFLEARYIRGGT